MWHVCVRACVRACVHACVRACVCVLLIHIYVVLRPFRRRFTCRVIDEEDCSCEDPGDTNVSSLVASTKLPYIISRLILLLKN